MLWKNNQRDTERTETHRVNFLPWTSVLSDSPWWINRMCSSSVKDVHLITMDFDFVPYYLVGSKTPFPYWSEIVKVYWCKVWTMVLCRKIQLIIFAETVLIPYWGKSWTHNLKSWIDLFDESRIVLEIGALLADRPGITQLNWIKYFHPYLIILNGRMQPGYWFYSFKVVF